MKKIIFIFILSFLLLGSRCKKQELKWKADFWAGSPVDGGIVNEKNEILNCVDPIFENYGCLHIDKINELRRILKKRCD
jgi:hypothetical protein